MKWSEAPKLRELAIQTCVATVAALKQMADDNKVKKAVKSDRLRRAIDYVARSRNATQCAPKADAGQAKKAETAQKPRKLSRLARSISAVCAMNPTQAEREADKLAAWADQAKKSDDDPTRVFDSMFMR